MEAPLWKTITDELRNELAENHFKRGDLFYSLQALAERHGVSLITAKRVYAELEKEGWIKRHRGKGTIVLRQGSNTAIKVLLPADAVLDASSKYNILEIWIGMAEAAAECRCDLLKFSNPSVFLNGSEKNNAFILLQDCDLFDTDERFAVLKNGSNNTVVVHAYSAKDACSSVGIDFHKGAFVATQHLVSLGHTRIACLMSLISNPWHTSRFEGYAAALKRARLKFDWRLVKEAGPDYEACASALTQLLALPDPPTAIFAAGGTYAFSALEYCRARGIRVPEDLSVVGFDNYPESAMTVPPLTTMDTHLKQLGKDAVYLLVDLINGKKSNQNVLIPPELVVRQSAAQRKKPCG